MVKAFSSGKNKPKQEDEQKARKKQAKKEAKLMLQVEQAKKDLRKAEQKATKAQAHLQEQQAHVQKVEQELTQFRHVGQEATTDVHAEAATDTIQTAQNTSSDELQASSLPAEGRDDIDANSEISTEADDIEIQVFSLPPVEGSSDVAQENATETPVEITNTPIEDIPTSDETAGAQVHADISIAPDEDGPTISSGDGSIPVVTTDEHAWPPPQIREELAQAIAQEVAQEHQAENGRNEAEGGAEKDLAITSGEGSMPVVTTDEHAWPPPQIREELAQAIAQDVAQEQAASDGEHGEAHESDVDEEAEHHDEEHEEGPSRPRRPARRRARPQQNTNNQE